MTSVHVGPLYNRVSPARYGYLGTHPLRGHQQHGLQYRQLTVGWTAAPTPLRWRVCLPGGCRTGQGTPCLNSLLLGVKEEGTLPTPPEPLILGSCRCNKGLSVSCIVLAAILLELQRIKVYTIYLHCTVTNRAF